MRRLPFALLVLALSSSARADTILFVTTVTRGPIGYCCTPLPPWRLYWGVYQPEAPLQQVVPLFEDRLFTEADIGDTFAADSTSDPDFADVASLLTNGEDNQMSFALGGSEGGVILGQSESDFFTGLDPRLGVDLFGYEVTRITFRIDHLAFLPDVDSSREGAGDIEGRFTYGFEGEPPPPIPEPATLALVGSGVLGLAAKRNRRRFKL